MWGKKEANKNTRPCEVCGVGLILEKEWIYTAYVQKGAFQVIASGHGRTYDATDCPACGCQNVLKERFPQLKGTKQEDEDTEEGSGDE